MFLLFNSLIPCFWLNLFLCVHFHRLFLFVWCGECWCVLASSDFRFVHFIFVFRIFFSFLFFLVKTIRFLWRLYRIKILLANCFCLCVLFASMSVCICHCMWDMRIVNLKSHSAFKHSTYRMVYVSCSSVLAFHTHWFRWWGCRILYLCNQAKWMNFSLGFSFNITDIIPKCFLVKSRRCSSLV